jgi:hypothetical protein
MDLVRDRSRIVVTDIVKQEKAGIETNFERRARSRGCRR